MLMLLIKSKVRVRQGLFGFRSSNNLKCFKKLYSSTESGDKDKDEKIEKFIQGPGAKKGTIGSDFDHSVGIERLEMLSKLAGRSIFSSSEILCHPRGDGFKGTLTDPVLVESLATTTDGTEIKQRIVGCSGVPKGSHEIGFFWVRSEKEANRCGECGQAFKLKLLL